jgi:Fur family ferric uptake transcriptional regulator
MTSHIERLCKEKNISLTDNRKVIAKVISESEDHPDVEEVFRRASKVNPSIGIATVYRAVKMFEEAGVVERHDFGGKGKARYEVSTEDDHHDHLVDISTDEVHEFFSQELEDLQEKIARDMGYEIVGHKFELYCKPIKKQKSKK